MSPLMLLSEDVLSFRAAAKRLPPLDADHRIGAATLRRWASHGARGKRLETLRLGSRVLTTWQAVERFLAALNESSD